MPLYHFMHERNLERMPVATERPRMTVERAALIGLLQRYTGPGMGVTPIEMQKLMYLLETSGVPLRLHFAQGHYGPYAESINHMLQTLEGHFVRGYGDRSRSVLDADSLELVPGALKEADRILAGRPDIMRRFDWVLQLIEGFESSYGLELLSTVHWIATRKDSRAAEDASAVVPHMRSWNVRKQRLFNERDIKIAWTRLHQAGWFALPA